MDSKFNRLVYFCQANNYPEFYRILLDAKKANELFDLLNQLFYGWSILHHACHEGRTDFVELLLHFGASINIKSDWDKTPLQIACNNGCLECIKLLLDFGYDSVPNDLRLPIGCPEEIEKLLQEWQPPVPTKCAE